MRSDSLTQFDVSHRSFVSLSLKGETWKKLNKKFAIMPGQLRLI